MKVVVKKKNGVAETNAAGQEVMIHAIDAMERVKAGTHIAEYKEVQVGDEGKKRILVAVKEKNKKDLEKEAEAKKAHIEKLKAEEKELQDKLKAEGGNDTKKEDKAPTGSVREKLNNSSK